MELTKEEKRIAVAAYRKDSVSADPHAEVYAACEAVLESRAASDQGLRKAAQEAITKIESIAPMIDSVVFLPSPANTPWDILGLLPCAQALKAALARQVKDGPVLGDESLRKAAHYAAFVLRSVELGDVSEGAAKSAADNLEAALTRGPVIGDEQPPYKKCGKVAQTFIAREGSFFTCALEEGHEGPCLQSGTCFRHGVYFGKNCPHWPKCADQLLAPRREPSHPMSGTMQDEVRVTDRAQEPLSQWEDAHTENQWPSGRKKIVAEQGNIPIAEDLSNDLDRRSLAAAFAYKLVGKFPSIEQAVIAPSLMREAGLAFLALIERTSRAEAERDEYQAKSYRNMCRDQHMQIGFEGEDFQPCPVCQLQGEVAQLKAENQELRGIVRGLLDAANGKTKPLSQINAELKKKFGMTLDVEGAKIAELQGQIDALRARIPPQDSK